ncbi:hypothetical protein JB92DRAFT_2269835 [Gautieria morchelliformis]|nr:hypothetical protein JB92DRAFT_2269835 [Gautieria morchelliformis]
MSSLMILPGIEGLLSARVYAMSQHNQGMPWVLGALGLVYMGSLGTGVFIVTKDACNSQSGCGRYKLVTDTINNVFIILFDTLVVVATLYNTLGLVRRSREFPMLPQKSLSRNLAEQSLIRYGKVLYDVQFRGTYLPFSITGVKTQHCRGFYTCAGQSIHHHHLSLSSCPSREGCSP